MESKLWAGVSWDAIPQKLQREKRENRIVGRSCLRPQLGSAQLGSQFPTTIPSPG